MRRGVQRDVRRLEPANPPALSPFVGKTVFFYLLTFFNTALP